MIFYECTGCGGLYESLGDALNCCGTGAVETEGVNTQTNGGDTMNFWVSYLLGFASCAASLGVFLFGHCLRLAAERDRWIHRYLTVTRLRSLQAGRGADEPLMEVAWQGGIPVVQPVECPHEIEVENA